MSDASEVTALVSANVSVVSAFMVEVPLTKIENVLGV